MNTKIFASLFAMAMAVSAAPAERDVTAVVIGVINPRKYETEVNDGMIDADMKMLYIVTTGKYQTEVNDGMIDADMKMLYIVVDSCASVTLLPGEHEVTLSATLGSVGGCGSKLLITADATEHAIVGVVTKM
jgi:hypothetical protein